MSTLLLILLSWSPLLVLSYLITAGYDTGQLLEVGRYFHAAYGCLAAFAFYDAVIKPRYKERRRDVPNELDRKMKRKPVSGPSRRRL